MIGLDSISGFAASTTRSSFRVLPQRIRAKLDHGLIQRIEVALSSKTTTG